jgi:hypothetical protein
VTYTSSFYPNQRTNTKRHWNGTFCPCVGISMDASEYINIMKEEERRKKKKQEDKKE